jgi:hypothetical protein
MTRPKIILSLRVFTEPLHSNDKGMHIQTQKLTGGIYEICRCDMLRRFVTHTNFRNIGSDIQTLLGGYTEKQTAWQYHKPRFIFFSIFLIKKVG